MCGSVGVWERERLTQDLLTPQVSKLMSILVRTSLLKVQIKSFFF